MIVDMTKNAGIDIEIDWSDSVEPAPATPAVEQAPSAAPSADLAVIATEAAANAATQGIGSMAGGQMRIVGFATADGYVQAIRNGVPARTHAQYVTTLRTRYGMTSGEITALNLPGPMEQSAAPAGTGIRHIPNGPSIFDRPASERAFKVGGQEPSYVEIRQAAVNPSNLVSVADAEAMGVLIAWNGRHPITRGALVAKLEAIGEVDLAPRATSARAQAGRAIEALTSKGYVVRFERRAAATATSTAPADRSVRWSVGHVASDDGDELGKRVLRFTLTEGGELSFTSPLPNDTHTALGSSVVEDFKAKVATEIYQSADLTSWLSGVLRKHCTAVQFGALGYYVPARHRERAERICGAVRDAGFGAGWALPGLPVTTSDQLRDGLLRGLTDEVQLLMEKLATERESARSERAGSDIGPKRAQTFLVDLRKIGERVAAYETVLGTDRVIAAKATIRTAISELEGLLGEEHSGISARFSNVWDEIQRDSKR
jgi:hypothetical protein